MGRVEGEELAELVDRQDERLRRAFAEIGVADPELGIGPIRALRCRFR
jgi:hypothetical protein